MNALRFTEKGRPLLNLTFEVIIVDGSLSGVWSPDIRGRMFVQSTAVLL